MSDPLEDSQPEQCKARVHKLDVQSFIIMPVQVIRGGGGRSSSLKYLRILNLSKMKRIKALHLLSI